MCVCVCVLGAGSRGEVRDRDDVSPPLLLAAINEKECGGGQCPPLLLVQNHGGKGPSSFLPIEESPPPSALLLLHKGRGPQAWPTLEEAVRG